MSVLSDVAERAAADPWADVEPKAYAVHAVAAQSGGVPLILEYHRADDDQELNFIPKTVAGFAFGAMVMGFCLNLSTLLLFSGHGILHISMSMATRFVFACGSTGVASSLLLVGLKVRADHSALVLHSRHWVNSIVTGTIYSLLVWGPWLAVEMGFGVDRFAQAAIWMLLFVYPLIAARWTVGPVKPRGA